MSLPKEVTTALSKHSEKIEFKIIDALSKSKQDKLKSAMLYLLKSGGKRLRASLPFLVGELFSNAGESHYDLGAAIEIIHNFTLIHDDIMDDDAIRRGRPSVHMEYDIPTAINAGDAMLAVAFEVISSSKEIEVSNIPKLVNIIGSMVRRVSEGQQLDIDNENRRGILIDDYLEMIEGKTAVMFETCAKCGAILSGATDEEIDLIGEWGLNLGLCFQIVDDLIDLISDTELSGKPLGSDLVQGKMTCMVIHAMSNKENDLKYVNSILGRGTSVKEEEIISAINELENTGSIQYCIDLAKEYYNKSKKSLDYFCDNPGYDVLSELTEYHISRIT